MLQQEYPELKRRYWGKHFWAIFEDGVRAALFDDSLDVAAFPIEESDAGLRKVGESGNGGSSWVSNDPEFIDISLR